jgi:allophanate hydrolase
LKLDLASLRGSYASESFAPEDVVREIFRRVRHEGTLPIWIELVPEESAVSRARTLLDSPRDLPLWGIPFAVKDNFDVAGMPTTAGCPDFAYTPPETATVVQRLLDAGAILIGKTNLDQFATGLVGVRSPYGACSSVFDSRYISGGSSSGSAVAVAKGLVTFSLGTDTAGSGRVPAAFNNLVGLKASRGLLSTKGLVPACRTLDCVSIFSNSCSDARAVFEVAKAYDALDPFSRPMGQSRLWVQPPFRFGVPRQDQLEFFGDTEAARLFDEAVERMSRCGGEPVVINFSPFREAAALLYSGPWVAERFAAIEEFLISKPDSIHPVVRNIIEGASKYSAVDSFRAAYRLAELRRQTDAEWPRMDVLLLPTTGTIYTHEEIARDPVALNSNLGYYTNFVNLLDLAAVAVPAGFRANGLPFGVSIIAPAFSDDALLSLAGWISDETNPFAAPGFVEIAVVGAHLTGQPLNRQLTDRAARLVKTCRTAPGYRLFALANTMPPKPGLVHEPGFSGPGIEVEVWAVPLSEFGSFVAGVPPPLGIGNCTLDDGTSVKSFICEPYAIPSALEITQLGGWRAYLAQARGI